MFTRSVVVVVGLLGLTGCSQSSSSSSAPGARSTVRSATIATTAATRACIGAIRFGTDDAPNEIHVKVARGQVWGLAFGRVPPRAGEELKIVWRMTGTGPLRVALRAPDGRSQPLVFGPEAHPTSSYKRPGDEWGTGFRFPVRGCWHIHLARTDTSADVRLAVT